MGQKCLSRTGTAGTTVPDTTAFFTSFPPPLPARYREELDRLGSKAFHRALSLLATYTYSATMGLGVLDTKEKDVPGTALLTDDNPLAGLSVSGEAVDVS